MKNKYPVHLNIPCGFHIQASLEHLYNFFLTGEGKIEDYIPVKTPLPDIKTSAIKKVVAQVKDVLTNRTLMHSELEIILKIGKDGYVLPLGNDMKPEITLEQFLVPAFGPTKYTFEQALDLIESALSGEMYYMYALYNSEKEAQTGITRIRVSDTCCEFILVVDYINAETMSRMETYDKDFPTKTFLFARDNRLVLQVQFKS